MLDVTQLNIFSKVVDLKSFSDAAAALHLTQSAVSQQISSIEDHIEEPLFISKRKKIVLTPIGKYLYEYSCKILFLLDEACRDIEHFKGHDGGTVRMSAGRVLAEHVLPGALLSFRASHPDVTCQILIRDSESAVRELLSGLIDFGFVDEICKDTESLIFEKVFEDEFVIITGPDHIWSVRNEIFPEEIVQEDFVMPEAGSEIRKAIDSQLSEAGVPLASLRITAELGSPTAIMEAVLSGCGVSIVSQRAAVFYLEHNLLKRVKLKNVSLKKKYFLVQNEKNTLCPLCHQLVDFLKTELSLKEQHRAVSAV